MKIIGSLCLGWVLVMAPVAKADDVFNVGGISVTVSRQNGVWQVSASDGAQSLGSVSGCGDYAESLGLANFASLAAVAGQGNARFIKSRGVLSDAIFIYDDADGGRYVAKREFDTRRCTNGFAALLDKIAQAAHWKSAKNSCQTMLTKLQAAVTHASPEATAEQLRAALKDIDAALREGASTASGSVAAGAH